MSRGKSRRLPRGTKVRVPKGTPLHYSTAPWGRKPTIGRSQTVTVSWMTHSPDAIYWAGSGGYWLGVLLTDDMVVVEEPSDG